MRYELIWQLSLRRRKLSFHHSHSRVILNSSTRTMSTVMGKRDSKLIKLSHVIMGLKIKRISPHWTQNDSWSHHVYSKMLIFSHQYYSFHITTIFPSCTHRATIFSTWCAVEHKKHVNNNNYLAKSYPSCNILRWGSCLWFSILTICNFWLIFSKCICTLVPTIFLLVLGLRSVVLVTQKHCPSHGFPVFARRIVD